MATSVSRFNYQERMGEIQAKLCDYGKRMNLSHPINLSIIKFNESPCAKIDSKTISIPSWFLFKYDDIPPRFQVSDMNDPRLVNPAFLTEFAQWMNEKIAELGLTSIYRPVDHGILQMVIRLLREPAQFEKGKNFILGHELAHLAHSQNAFMEKVYETLAVGGTMSGIFLISLALSIAPVVHIGVTVGVSGIGVALTAGCIASIIHRDLAALSMVQKEKKADLDAVKMLGDARGGIYYFQSSIDRNLVLRPHRDIDERGNDLKDKSHPLLTDRVAYLTQWQRERGSN